MEDLRKENSDVWQEAGGVDPTGSEWNVIYQASKIPDAP